MALTDNLVAYWSLEEASGGSNDAHSTNHLSDNNTVTQATGKVGNARQFTLANQEFLSIADNAALSGSDRDFSFVGWVYIDSTGITHHILSKGGGTGTAALEYRLIVTGVQRLAFNVSNGSTATTVTDSVFGAFAASTWYFCEAWHDSVNNVIGVRVNRNASSNTAAHSVGVQNGTQPFRLGSGPGTNTQYLNGRLDEWALYDRILSSTELDDWYNSGSGRNYAYISGAAASGQPMALRQSHMRRGVARIGRGY